MSNAGTQSPPLESTSQVDPMGAVNIQGDKATGVKDVDQRAEQFGEGTEQKATSGTENDMTKLAGLAKESADAFESKRDTSSHA